MPKSIVSELIDKIVDECGGGFTQRVLDTLHAELNFHPAVLQVLRWFVDDGREVERLTIAVYKDFSSLALRTAVRGPQNPETAYALSELLNSRNCAVRAAIDNE